MAGNGIHSIVHELIILVGALVRIRHTQGWALVKEKQIKYSNQINSKFEIRNLNERRKFEIEKSIII